MKKLLALVSLFLLAVVLVIPTQAASTAQMTITPSKATAYRGDEIVFTVSISQIDSCVSGFMEFSYDSAVFEWVSGSCLVNATISSVQKDGTGAYVGSFAYSTSNPQTVSGNIFQFVLKVKSDASMKTTSVTGVDVTFKDSAGAVTTAVQPASVTVSCNHTYGQWEKVDDKDHARTCSVTGCGHKEVKPHSWDTGAVTSGATCKETGTKTYTCGDCGATKTETIDKKDHTYTNACDTDCNSCGAIRTVTHSYSTKWSSDGTKHWHECSVCKARSDEGAHIPGPAPTEWTAQTCKTCGYELKAALGHTHKFQLNWTMDANGHWHECTGCEDLGNYEDHVFDDDCDTQCNTCGYTRTITHVYMDRWSFDADGHWHECTICGEVLEKTPHVPDSQDDEQRCTVCGYVAPPEEHTHSFVGDYFKDKTGHWKQCSCGQFSEAEPHIWNGGTADTATGETVYACTLCGEEKREAGGNSNSTSPSEEGPQETTGDAVKEELPENDQFPWKILLIVVAVLVVSLGAYLIIGIIGGKKQKGRFSAK